MRAPTISPTRSGIFRRDMAPNTVRQIFRDQVDLIWSEWRDRGSASVPDSSGAAPESRDDKLLRSTYRLVKALISKGHSGELGNIITSLAAPPPSGSSRKRLRHRGQHAIDDQPFKQALLIIYGVKAPANMVRSREWRREVGDALEYAYQHSVPSKYVLGFIKQSGGYKSASRKLAIEGCHEPEFVRRP